MPSPADAMTRRLHDAGLRHTPVRAEVLRLLGEASKPLAAAGILRKLPEGTDVVTLYRTLKTFVDKGLAHKVRAEDRSWRYAVGAEAATAHRHAHFVCSRCGRMECGKELRLPTRALAKAAVDAGYEVEYAEVTLHGRCPKCRR